MMTEFTLQDIFYQIKPELEDNGDLHGSNIIEDLDFDLIDVVELFSKLDDIFGIEDGDIVEMLDIIEDYDKIEEWVLQRIGTCECVNSKE